MSSPGRLDLSDLNPLLLLMKLVLLIQQHSCLQVASNMHVFSMKDAKCALQYSRCVPTKAREGRPSLHVRM